MPAEVPCARVVSFAKKTLEDAAGSSSAVVSCPVVKGLSKLSTKDAEERLHPILVQNGLSLPIELTPLSGDLDGFPRLKPLNFLQHMASEGKLNRLLGGRQINTGGRDMLEEFWQRYEVVHPDFSFFLEDNKVDKGMCIPVFAHADGGRGYKKSEFMVFNWSSAIGSGTGKANRKDNFSSRPLKRRKGMQVNLLGHTFGTHFMWGAAPAMWRKDDSHFQSMMTALGEDLKECFDTGVLYQGQRLRLVCIGLKADLKLQARAGRLTRWYSTCRKSAYDPAKKNQTLGYCCWLCPAGSIDFPFEEVHTESPAWFKAMGQFAATPPWKDGEVNGILANSFSYMAQPAKFYLADLFHVYLAGFGQDHAASCLVYMLGVTFDGSSVDTQLESLNAAWKLWRKFNKVSTHTYTWTRNMLGFPNATTFPSGTWSKASDTAKIMEFILYMCDVYSDKIAGDRILYYIQVAGTALGTCMKGLYDADLWIEPGCYELYMICPPDIKDLSNRSMIYKGKPSTTRRFLEGV